MNSDENDVRNRLEDLVSFTMTLSDGTEVEVQYDKTERDQIIRVVELEEGEEISTELNPEDRLAIGNAVALRLLQAPPNKPETIQ